MPSIAVKLYSVFFKFLLKHRLQTLVETPVDSNSFGVTSRPEEAVAAANPSFVDGVASKDLHIDPLSSLSLRIFLPDTCLSHSGAKLLSDSDSAPVDSSSVSQKGPNLSVYGGYSPPVGDRSVVRRKLPVILQFHGGGFVGGSNDSAANDLFCRRIAKLCDAIVVAVGYRLAPESRYPAAFEDGLKALNWLGKQGILADCSESAKRRKSDVHRHVIDAFGASMAEPWLAAHGDPTRCVLLGVGCGANIADHVSQKAVEAGNLLDPVKVVAQVLMYPFFIGSVPTHSEIKLANSYFYDKAMCKIAWKLFLPEKEFNLDHPTANPLIPWRRTPLKDMPPTLTVVAEHDWMRDRAIAYSEELRKVKVDAPLLEYKDAVHGFATLDVLLKTPQALACAEDISIWVKKYISIRGHEFSY